MSVVMEHDEGNPEAVKSQVETVVALAAAAAAALGVPVPEVVQSFAADVVTWVLDPSDDEVGTDVVVIPPLWLRQGASQAPANYVGTRTVLRPVGVFQYEAEQVFDRTDLQYSFVSSHNDDGAYIVTYRVSADREPNDGRPALEDLVLQPTRDILVRPF